MKSSQCELDRHLSMLSSSLTLTFTLPNEDFGRPNQHDRMRFLESREALFNDFRPNLLLTPLKSSSRDTHSERLVRTSKIFVWGSITWTLIIEKKCAKLARFLSTHACKSPRQVVGAQSRKFCSLHLTIPNEDFGRPNQHYGMRFPGRTFQGR